MIGRSCGLRLPPVSAPPSRPSTASAFDPAPPLLRTPDVALPCTYCMSVFFGSAGTRPSWLSVLVDETNRMWVSGSYEPPGQLVPPPAAPSASVASGPSTLLTAGGVNHGPIRYLDASCF